MFYLNYNCIFQSEAELVCCSGHYIGKNSLLIEKYSLFVLYFAAHRILDDEGYAYIIRT